MSILTEPKNNTILRDREMIIASYALAEKFATDPSTQNGAIIANYRGHLVKGANHFPKGVAENEGRWERPLKYSYVEHAERNAIYEAARLGVSTEDATMYTPWLPCVECSRAIIQAGIKTLVTHKTSTHNNSNPKWHESQKLATDMLEEAGVEMRYVEGELGGITIRMNGELVNP